MGEIVLVLDSLRHEDARETKMIGVDDGKCE